MGTLFFGGTIYTMESENSSIEAMFVENGMIKMIGEESYLREQLANKIEQEWNLDGAILYPGFVDSHLHIIGHGEKLLRLDLSAMQSAEEVLRAVEERAKNLSTDEWLIAEGWNENQWEDARIINKKELDAIST